VTTYEYISVLIPPTIDDTMAILKAYGDTGWKVAAMYNGYIFFERRVKIKIR
jgi:hypothetical protein